jgi:hypothetical protein
MVREYLWKPKKGSRSGGFPEGRKSGHKPDEGGPELEDELHIEEGEVHRIKTREEIEEENVKKLQELKRQNGIE